MRPALKDEGLVVKTLSGGGGREARVLVDLKQPFGVVLVSLDENVCTVLLYSFSDL